MTLVVDTYVFDDDINKRFNLYEAFFSVKRDTNFKI